MLKIVDLYADWCMPCRAQKPILDEIEVLYKNEPVEIERVNVDANDEKVQYYDVRSIPTMVFIKDGQVVEKHTGLIQKQDLINKIDTHLNA